MQWHEKYGPWALVTGASSGLGTEFVKQLAARGLNVVLVARRAERMEALADGVQRAYDIQTRVIPGDLTVHDTCCLVKDQTSDLEVGLLVNNAGFGLSGAYADLDPDRVVNMTVLNCVVPVMLTNYYLPPMIKRGRGGLIFLASTAAYQATPYLGVYGATKAFNLLMGESLWKEYRAKGIDCLALSPGFTKTEFTRVAHIRDASGFREATPDAVVSLALRKLGRKPSVIHGAANKVLNFTGRLIPRRTAIAVTSAMLKGRTLT
jgi:short-subunit dehydrogenase